MSDMLGTTTPAEITEPILTFCRQIDPTQIPTFLSIHPDPKAIKAECFSNVREHVAAHGGSMQLGWIIWETAGIMLEGNFHAVWRSPEGELLDVTPQVDGEGSILFLPDTAATISRERGDVVAMRRSPLVDDPVLAEYIATAERRDGILVRRQGMLTQRDLNEMTVIETRKAALMKTLALKYRGAVGAPSVQPLSFRPDCVITHKIGRNEPCPCGSGKKYKKCHGK